MRRAPLNRLLTAALILAGAALWAMSGLIVARDWPKLVRLYRAPVPAVAHRQGCAAAAKALGFDVHLAGASLRVTRNRRGLDQPRAAFDHASLLIALCGGYRLESFCAGQACGDNALFFSLTPVGLAAARQPKNPPVSRRR